MSQSEPASPASRARPGLALALALALAPSACAGEPRENHEALAQVLAIHGWECDAVRSYRALEDGWIDVRCADGRSYEVRLGPAWQADLADRRTGLRPLLDVARHARALDAGDPAERIAGARGLEAMGARAAPATGALVAALDDQDPRVRVAVIEALGAIGPAAEPAAGHLARIALEAGPPLAAAAREALGRITGGG